LNSVIIHREVTTVKPQIILLLVLLLVSQSFAAEQPAAKVNDSLITEKEVAQEVSRLIPQSTFHARMTPERQAEFRDKALENLIVRELQYQDAIRLKLVVDKKRVDEELAGIKKRFRTKQEYREALQSAEMTEDEFKRTIEKNILVQLAVEKNVTGPSRFSDEAVKDHYEKNLSKSRIPESVRVRIISSQDKAKVVSALERIQTGEDFGHVAAQVSEDNYRIKGGDVGYVHKGRLLPEIEAEAFSLKIGAVSKIFKADDKWFLIKVEDRKEAYQKSFEEAKDGLKKELEQQRANELMSKWMEGLRAKAHIETISSVVSGTSASN
jgi:parvulin-like peptidyl-prolyl isomerase